MEGRNVLDKINTQVGSELVKINNRIEKKKIVIIMDPEMTIRRKQRSLDNLFNEYCKDVKKILGKYKNEQEGGIENGKKANTNLLQV